MAQQRTAGQLRSVAGVHTDEAQPEREAAEHSVHRKTWRRHGATVSIVAG
jgi:hypothetical protein